MMMDAQTVSETLQRHFHTGYREGIKFYIPDISALHTPCKYILKQDLRNKLRLHQFRKLDSRNCSGGGDLKLFLRVGPMESLPRQRRMEAVRV